MKDYYKILGVRFKATTSEIEAAFERLLELQKQSPEAYSEQRKQEINEAHESLLDPLLREEYDQQLREYYARLHKEQNQTDVGHEDSYKDVDAASRWPTPLLNISCCASITLSACWYFFVFALYETFTVAFNEKYEYTGYDVKFGSVEFLSILPFAACPGVVTLMFFFFYTKKHGTWW